uniref:Reverse transcriptase zinc-binding domain-containing protein n=1 Tax=Cannabis sativa TaxID=3483 RepID=A0A803PW11_CANSA
MMLANGQEVDIWYQPWIPWMDYVEFRTVMEEVRVRAPNLRTVADLLRGSPLEWRKEYVLYLFGREKGERILSISLSNRLGRDTLIWKEARDGKFSVKGAYWFEQQGRFNSNNEIWRLTWDGKMHPRQSIFLWRLCVGALPTKDKYAGESNQECVLCGFCCESADHLFMQCPLSRALWLGAPLPVKSNEVSGENLMMKVLTLVKGLSKDLRLQAMVSFAAVCDTVWNQRNAIIHGGKCGDIPSLLTEVWRKFVDFGGDKVGEVSDSRSHLVTRPLVPYQFNKMVMVDGAYKESCKEGSSSLEAEMSAIGLAVEMDWFKLDVNRPSNVLFDEFMVHTLCVIEEIWKERNRRSNGKKEDDMVRITDLITLKIKDHVMVSSKSLPVVLSWNPPPSSWKCCNSDIAISNSESVLSVVLRDEWGNVVAIKTALTPVTNPMLAEALAVCSAADLAVSMGVTHILFQSDNLSVVK